MTKKRNAMEGEKPGIPDRTSTNGVLSSQRTVLMEAEAVKQLGVVIPRLQLIQERKIRRREREERGKLRISSHGKAKSSVSHPEFCERAFAAF